MRNQVRISSEAVAARTGKSWEEWFAVLDKAGAKKMAHKDIALLLYEKHEVPGWWCQMVAVGYEQARGLRVVHQQAEGFTASVSRTLNASLSAVYDAWTDPRKRKRWLGDHKMTIREANENKSMRITWPDSTTVEVSFYAKGEAKTQVTVQNNKLARAEDVGRSKEFWKGALERLRNLLKG